MKTFNQIREINEDRKKDLKDLETLSIAYKDQLDKGKKDNAKKLDIEIKKLAKKLGVKEEVEQVEEGKYTKYSDLLIKKAKLVAQGPIASKEVAAVNKQIAAEMKKLGVKEEVQEKVVNRELDALKKKFKADLKKYENDGYFKNPKAQQAFMDYAMDNGEVRTDDPDEFEAWMDREVR